MFSFIVHILRAAVKMLAAVLMIGAWGKMLETKSNESLSHGNKIEQMICDMSYMLVMAMILCA